MHPFIILSNQGTTFLPEDNDHEINNLQVLGFSDGFDAKEAVQNYLIENSFITNAGYNEVIALELKAPVEDKDFSGIPVIGKT